MKNIYLFLIFVFFLIGSLTFINFDSDKNQEIKFEKQPFKEVAPELQNEINYQIDKFYYEKYNKRRIIFEWD